MRSSLAIVIAIALAGLLSSGAAPAAPVTYVVDPAHTYPSFEADHMGLSVWRGKFNQNAGTVTLDKAAAQGSVDITVEVGSIDFGLPLMNTTAQAAELFDVAKYPQARYRGRLGGFVNGAPTRVDGELTLHGVTRPVSLQLNRFKCMPHPLLKRELCGADALTTIQRDAFGIDAGKDYGFDMAVTLRIQVEAVAAE